MDVKAAVLSNPSHLKPLRDAVFSSPAAHWESFSFSGENGAPPLHLEDRASRFFGVRGANGQADDPLFEEQYGLNPAKTSARHLVRVGLKLGTELELAPDTVLTGPEVTQVFGELDQAIRAHYSRTAEL